MYNLWDGSSYVVANPSRQSNTHVTGQHTRGHCEDEDLYKICGASRSRIQGPYRALCFSLTSAFLHRVLAALAEERFPHLTQVGFVGFHILKTGNSRRLNPYLTRQCTRGYLFADEGLMEAANIECWQSFTGYDYYLAKMDQHEFDELKEILRRS
ncbi:hypothetical protein ANO14919_059850 [Xylariales sp. No.14919]|nr:hypothetical protein ANO14919_059850 [Xylariales sp. No.14919]